MKRYTPDREARTAIKRDVGSALNPFLETFIALGGEQLLGVFVRLDSSSASTLIFRFESQALVLIADANGDTIDIHLEYANADAVHCQNSIFEEFMGKPFGWGYVVFNQQGYLDGVLLSFSGIIPQIAITTMASELMVQRISPTERLNI